MSDVTRQQLLEWCRVRYDELEGHPDLRIPFRLCPDAAAMGRLMAQELVDLVAANERQGRATRAIIPCGPSGWYRPFVEIVNSRRLSLRRLVVFHMDECLDWAGSELPRAHPYSFRGFMERHFYDPVEADLRVPDAQRYWLAPTTVDAVGAAIAAEPVDIAYGGWGQDGHVAYNQARRHPYSRIGLDELRTSGIRIQENNPDTLLALAHRTFGAAYQFVPPMSVTLGMREVLSARLVRLFSDTGAWKQTALRVGLFAPPTTEYPITLLGEHPDALLTATIDTARHPISEHPEWDLGIT